MLTRVSIQSLLDGLNSGVRFPICAYLTDKFQEKGLAPEIGSVERAAYYRYLFVSSNTIEPTLSITASGLAHPEPTSTEWGDIPLVLATIEAMTPENGWWLSFLTLYILRTVDVLKYYFLKNMTF